ncbi:MAG: hypothetical protein AB7P33_07845 [Dehalococcoidia bacterium]
MQGTGIGTSLVLIATGAVLAMAVDYQVSGIDINAVGVILMVVGVIGLLMSLMMLGGLDWFGSRGTTYDRVHEGPSTVEHVTREREVVREVEAPTSETTVTRTTRRL